MQELKWPLNLQLFAGGDDDGFDDDADDTPDDDDFFDEDDVQDTQEADKDDDIEAEDTKPADVEPDEPAKQETPQTLKLKYNGEDREISLEEAITLAQKGMNYDKMQSRVDQARQEARDAYIAEQRYEWKGQIIQTEAEYQRALQEQRDEQAVLDMAEKEGVPEEFAKRMVAVEQREKARDEELNRMKSEADKQARQQADINDFLKTFEGLNERPFDGKTDALPQSVWDKVNAGTPLRFAYIEYHSQQLRNQLKIAQQNESNSQKAAIGSVTANGNAKKAAVDPFMAAWDED
jgi:hypothetical protein